MRYTKTLFSLSFLMLLIGLLAACGSTSTGSTTTSSYGSSSTAPTATANTGSTPTTISKYSDGTTPTTGTNSTSTSTVKTTNATIDGKAETILTNAQGMTLYYFTPDTKTTAACTAGCTGTWPPLLATGSITLTGTAPGKLTTATNANGMQVQYNGHFLYTYAGDTAPSQTNGQGIGGKWFVATSSLV